MIKTPLPSICTSLKVCVRRQDHALCQSLEINTSINTRQTHLTFNELSNKYGKLFRVSLLGEDIVVINDINMPRKAFLGEEYGDLFAD